ncbi:MAG: UvrD-helicase domain-containing protein [Pirellulales bacterium]
MSNTVLVDPPQLVIRASAGSGKTFQLSNRFLQLIQKDAPISEILATTFTRKAAGEILERILLRLSCAATDSAAAEELAGFLGDSNLTQERCLELLERMARQMHRLRVGTLDSFFAQMARSHSVEIGLPPGWQIVDEITGARLRDRALEEVMESNATDDVTRLVNLLAKGDAERSVSQLARDTIDSLYALYLASDERAWQVPRGTPLSEDTLAEACSTLAKVLLPTDQRFAQARNKDLDAARAADWEGFIERGLAKKVLDGATHYCSKEIAPKIRAAYQPLLEHVKAVFLAQLANQTEATFELLQKYDTVLQRL